MKLNESQTSLEAYRNNIENFDNRGDQAVAVLRQHGDLTSNEIFSKIENTFPLNYRHNTHARLADKRDEGIVFENGKRVCSITGECVILWSLVPEGQQKLYARAALEKKLLSAEKLIAKIQKQLEELSQ
jgi:hypothetical protein